MNRIARISLLSALVIGFCLLAAMPANAGDNDQSPAVVKPIGNPMWKPVDFHVFTAQNADFAGQMKTLLYPLRHEPCAELGIGPGDPHQPPYLHEFQGNLLIVNISDSLVFKRAELRPRMECMPSTW